VIVRFVLLDRLIVLEPGRRAVARATFARHADVFADHFPGFPLVPGVLLTEAMAQTGGWLLAATSGFARWPVLTMVHNAKFRHLVRPDDEIRTEVNIRSTHDSDFEVAARALVGDRRVADARLAFHLLDLQLGGAEREQFERWLRTTFAGLGGPDLVPDLLPARRDQAAPGGC
jgi:3-hydroxyacyl-[acyl-carrier-protein] dehydratase